MKDRIGFSGFIGNRNLGDEAIFQGCVDLFAKQRVLDLSHCDDIDLILYGGGTWLPPAPHHRIEARDIPMCAIGVGIRDPVFHNNPDSRLDLGYYFGKMGKDNWLMNQYFDYVIRPFGYYIGSLHTSPHYIHPQHFEYLSKLNKLGVRGPRSKSILADFNIESTIVGDTALILHPTKQFNEKSGKIGITLRAGGRKWTDDNSYQDILMRFFKEDLDNFDLVFLPQYPRDIPLHLEFTNKLPNAQFKDYCTQIDVQSMINEYATCDIVISEKLHGNVLSACSFTPFLSLEYNPKNEDFAQSLKMDKYNIKITNLDLSWLQNQFNDLMTNNHRISNNLRSEVEDKRIRLKKFSEQIIRIIDD